MTNNKVNPPDSVCKSPYHRPTSIYCLDCIPEGAPLGALLLSNREATPDEIKRGLEIQAWQRPYPTMNSISTNIQNPPDSVMSAEQFYEVWRKKIVYHRVGKMEFKPEEAFHFAEAYADYHASHAPKDSAPPDDELTFKNSDSIPFSDSPCGHGGQYAYTSDGGKHVVCLLCEFLDAPKDSTPPLDKCGEFAGDLIAGASWFPCVLPKGHEPSTATAAVNGHCGGGMCFKHGEYVGTQCPQWPDCTKGAPKDSPRHQHHVLCSCLPSVELGGYGCKCRLEYGAPKDSAPGWTEREWQVAQELADKADISVMDVFRQGLRLYQLIQVGTHQIIEVNPEPKLAPSAAAPGSERVVKALKECYVDLAAILIATTYELAPEVRAQLQRSHDLAEDALAEFEKEQ